MPERSIWFFQKGLTGFRALAALWVAMYHLNSLVSERHIFLRAGDIAIEVTPLITIGWVGVDLFFVLSGFLLTTHLLDRYSREHEREVFVSYFGARVLRVVPAYWAQLFILFVVAFISTGRSPPWWGDIPAHMFMLQNFPRSNAFTINGAYWTLPVEFGFYICLPLLIKFIAGRGSDDGRAMLYRAGALALGCLAFSSAYRLVVFHVYSDSGGGALFWVTSQLPGTIDQFAMGMFAAVVFRAAGGGMRPWWQRRREIISTALVGIGFAGLLGMMYFLHHIYFEYWGGHWALFTWHGITSLFISLIVVAIAISGRATRLVFENPVAVFLGTISYSIYLWHLPVAIWVANWIKAPEVGLKVFALAALPAIIAVSTASYFLAERPFLRRKARLLDEGGSKRDLRAASTGSSE